MKRDRQFLVGEDEGHEKEEEKRNRDAALEQRRCAQAKKRKRKRKNYSWPPSLRVFFPPFFASVQLRNIVDVFRAATGKEKPR